MRKNQNMEARKEKPKEVSRKKGFSTSDRKQKQTEKFKKHLGSSSEGQGFADKRKKKIQYEYLKLLKKEKLQRNSNTDDAPRTEQTKPHFRHQQPHKKGASAFSGLVKKQKVQKQKAQKEKEEAERRHQEREAAVQTSRKKRKQNYRLLCKRTSKGQPVMRTQMEFLLAKIEKQINQT